MGAEQSFQINSNDLTEIVKQNRDVSKWPKEVNNVVFVQKRISINIFYYIRSTASQYN